MSFWRLLFDGFDIDYDCFLRSLLSNRFKVLLVLEGTFGSIWHSHRHFILTLKEVELELDPLFKFLEVPGHDFLVEFIEEG